MRSSCLTALAIALLLVTSPMLATGSSTQSEDPCNGAEKRIAIRENPDFQIKVRYTFQFSESAGRYCVRVKNEGAAEAYGTFGALVDSRRSSPNMPSLKPGEKTHVVKNISEHLDVKKDNHTLVLSAGQQDFIYNFTQEMNASDPDVPAPYIENVEVVRDDGNGSTALKVAVHNPTKRGYGIYVQAKTFETKQVDKIGAPQENETSVFTLPLEESSSEVVAGKVRVFDNVGEPAGKFDQKEFLAKPGNDTKAWDDEFENMPGVGGSPDYSNETARQYRAGYVDDELLSPTERRVGAVLTVLLLVGGMVWRRRQKHR